MHTVIVQSFHQWCVFPLLWLFEACLFYEKEWTKHKKDWTTFRVFRVRIKTDAHQICWLKMPKSRVQQLPQLRYKSLFPFHGIFRRCCKTGWTQSKDCSVQRPTRKKKQTKKKKRSTIRLNSRGERRHTDGVEVIDSIELLQTRVDPPDPSTQRREGYANLSQAHVCSDYGIWIWTLVRQRRSKIAVLSGGLACTRVWWGKIHAKCICNSSLIMKMNSGCLTSNYPTRSWFQARKKEKKKTNIIFVTVKHN